MLRLFPRALRELTCSTAPYELKPCNDDDDDGQSSWQQSRSILRSLLCVAVQAPPRKKNGPLIRAR